MISFYNKINFFTLMVAPLLIGNKAAYAMDAEIEKQYFFMGVGVEGERCYTPDGVEYKADIEYTQWMVDVDVPGKKLADWIINNNDVEEVYLRSIKTTLGDTTCTDVKKENLIKFLKKEKKLMPLLKVRSRHFCKMKMKIPRRMSTKI